MEKSFATDTGKIRRHNEDSAVVIKNGSSVLAVVADGMGGHKAGDTASRMACETFAASFRSIEKELSSREAVCWLHRTAEEANTNIYEYQKMHPQCRGMGTTLTAAFCSRSYTAYVNAGDSRLYALTDGRFRQVTKDHSLVGELVRLGQLTEEEAEKHPQKHVLTKALGTEKKIKPDTGILDWEKGDIILLSSDGLTNKVSDEEIAETLQTDILSDLPGVLIKKANDRGGEDNITLAAVRNRDVKV